LAKIVYHPEKQGQKPDARTRTPGDHHPQGGAEKTEHIVLQTENLDKELCKNWVVAFMQTVNLHNHSVNHDKLWNWVKNIGKQCPELGTYMKELLEVSELQQIQLTDNDQLVRIQEFDDTQVAGHQGHANTHYLQIRSHS
jgi:hypothetical protein